MLAFVVKSADDRQMGALLFQKNKSFKVYLPKEDHLSADYENKIAVAHGRLQEVTEPLVCLLEPGVLPDKHFVGCVLRTARRHPGFDVYHVNPPETKAWPRKLKGVKLFQKNVLEALEAPVSSFIFRTEALRAKAVFRQDSSLDTLATVLACASEKPVRNVWRQRLSCPSPEVPTHLPARQKQIRDHLEFFRWSEHFYGKDFPIGNGDWLRILAGELAKLYPAFTADYLKEQLLSFQAAQGPIRKVRASSALKNALKEREKGFTDSAAEN